jgi:hypothetical protein
MDDIAKMPCIIHFSLSTEHGNNTRCRASHGLGICMLEGKDSLGMVVLWRIVTPSSARFGIREETFAQNFYIRFKTKKEGGVYSSISTTDGKATTSTSWRGGARVSKSQAGVRVGDPQVCCPPRRSPGHAPVK